MFEQHKELKTEFLSPVGTGWGGAALLPILHRGTMQSLVWPSTSASSRQGIYSLVLSFLPRALSGTRCWTAHHRVGLGWPGLA